MWLRPKMGERERERERERETPLCPWGPAYFGVAVERARFVKQKQGPFYQLAMKPTGQPHILSQGEQGMEGPPLPPGSGGQVVRRWEAGRLGLLTQKTHHTRTKGPI